MKNNNYSKPIIGFTLGDINGIGPEIILKTLNDILIYDLITPVIYGSNKVLNYYKKILPDITINIQNIKEINSQNIKQINVINCWEEQLNIVPGYLEMSMGKYAAISLKEATKALKEGKINALVTAPINKKNIKSSDFNFIGHTPFFKSFFKVDDIIMLMVSENMKIALLTEHCSLKDITSNISTSKIINKIQLLNKCLKEDFLIDRPKIAVLGLNPHNGDDGLIGNEETDIILPAIKHVNQNNILAFGPYSADGFFARSSYQKFDAILCMYHDQGLIPFKSLSIGNGINFTAGIDYIRTSPDHGTAFDIAGKNIADESSFRKAIFEAVDIYRNRINFKEANLNPLKKQEIKSMNLNEDEQQILPI